MESMKRSDFMRKIGIALRVLLLGGFVWAAGMLPVSATDVWVAHWNSENLDIYVMDDTISYGTRGDTRWFDVSTKMVKNGQLQEVVHWEFSKYKTDMWRYETNRMRGTHTTVVIPRSNIFEYCMDQIGWPYTIRVVHRVTKYYF